MSDTITATVANLLLDAVDELKGYVSRLETAAETFEDPTADEDDLADAYDVAASIEESFEPSYFGIDTDEIIAAAKVAVGSERLARWNAQSEYVSDLAWMKFHANHDGTSEQLVADTRATVARLQAARRNPDVTPVAPNHWLFETQASLAL